MSTVSPQTRQLVDWRAAIIASAVAGLVFFILNLILIPASVGLSVSSTIRYFSSVLLGESILPPPDQFHFGAFIIALIVNFVLSFVFSLIIAYVVHTGGLLSGILWGAVLGLAVYLIDLYTLSVFRPWLYALSGWAFALTHIIFGAIAGGVYETLEVETFVPAQS